VTSLDRPAEAIGARGGAVPYLRLSGRWFERLRFARGCRVVVAGERGEADAHDRSAWPAALIPALPGRCAGTRSLRRAAGGGAIDAVGDADPESLLNDRGALKSDPGTLLSDRGALKSDPGTLSSHRGWKKSVRRSEKSDPASVSRVRRLVSGAGGRAFEGTAAGFDDTRRAKGCDGTAFECTGGAKMCGARAFECRGESKICEGRAFECTARAKICEVRAFECTGRAKICEPRCFRMHSESINMWRPCFRMHARQLNM
jgi:hypothetical protein